MTDAVPPLEETFFLCSNGHRYPARLGACPGCTIVAPPPPALPPSPAAASIATAAASLLVEARLANRPLSREDALAEALALYRDALARLSAAPPGPPPPPPPLAPPAPPLVGRTLGRYRVEHLIGEGGMAVVYRATNLDTREGVALKVLRAGSSEALWERFLQEARASRRVAHPAIARLEEVLEVDGERFLVLELVPGETLRAVLRRGPLLLREAAVIVERAAEAIAAAHQAGVLHTDLKPENLMVDAVRLGGAVIAHRVKVLDLGLAIVDRQDADGSETRAGGFAGTPLAMAPEQVRGERLDARCDVYALALILYEAASGVHPFAGAALPAIFQRKLTERVAPLSTRVPASPPPLDRLLDACLDPDPARRPADAGAFLRELRNVRILDEERLELT